MDAATAFVEEITVPSHASEHIDTTSIVETIIVSDIHLGSQVSRSKALLKTLKQYEMRRLILNGDVFDDLNFKRLDKHDWDFLSYIRKLSNPKRRCEVIWVAGNHDGAAEMLSQLLGVDVYDEYLWESGDKRFLAIHGHQFDRFLNQNIIITAMACWLYLIIQRLDGESQHFSRWIKRRSKKWLKVSRTLGEDAVDYAANKGADVVFCGHTHLTVALYHRGRAYYNSGCWTDRPSHYLRINGTQVQVCEVR